jgi:hypothetical protein
MNTKALTMITAATLSVLALSACGTQATMRTAPVADTQVADTQTRSSSQFASDGSPVTSDGTVSSSNAGSVSIGADGVHIDTGDGSSVDIGADGTQITTGDGSVSIGADGTHIDTGDGSVSVDANGVAVTPGSTSKSKAKAGSSSAPKATGGTSTGSAGSATSDAGSRDAGNRQGTFGTTGHVTLTGATRFAGTASSAVCDVNADQRTTTAQLPNGMTLVIDANGLDQSSMSLVDANDATWRADFNGTVALAMTATTTTVAGVRLAGSNGVVTLSATFAC